jgi:hypothetical protein
MKKLALILMFTSGAAAAQTVTYTNQYGMPIGTAQTNGNLTTYSNQYGQVVGYSQGTAPAMPPAFVAPAMPAPQPMPVAPIMPLMPTLLGR